MSNTQSLDLETYNELKNLMEDEFSEFLNVFLEDAESELKSISQGIQQNDFELISGAAHKLKSSAAYIGAFQLRDLSKQLEEQGKENIAENIGNIFSEANNAFTELKNQLAN